MRRIPLAIAALALAVLAACGGTDAVPELRLAADGTLTLDGEAIALDALEESHFEDDDQPVRVLIDESVAYRHVVALQERLDALDLDDVTIERLPAER